MPNCTVITFAPLELERDNLLVLALLENFSRHFCSGDERIAVRHILAIGKRQHVTGAVAGRPGVGGRVSGGVFDHHDHAPTLRVASGACAAAVHAPRGDHDDDRE